MSQPKVNLYIWYDFGSPDADFSDLHKWFTSYHWKIPISCAYTCFTSISNINIKHTWILRYSVLFLLRSLKEIEAVLDFAKLERDEIKTETQSIYFSEHLDSEGIKLLELDNTVLEALESGEKWVRIFYKLYLFKICLWWRWCFILEQYSLHENIFGLWLFKKYLFFFKDTHL